MSNKKLAVVRPVKTLNTRLFCADPGSKNHGFAVLGVGPVRIIRCGMFQSYLIKDMTVDMAKQTRDYRAVLRKAFKLGAVTHAVAERYQARFRGGEVELVNYMLGILGTQGVPTSLYLPVSWKAVVKKIVDLEVLYKLCKPVPDHTVDAVMIGLFHISKFGGYDLKSLSKAVNQKKLCKEIQQQYLSSPLSPARLKPSKSKPAR